MGGPIKYKKIIVPIITPGRGGAGSMVSSRSILFRFCLTSVTISNIWLEVFRRVNAYLYIAIEMMLWYFFLKLNSEKSLARWLKTFKHIEKQPTPWHSTLLRKKGFSKVYGRLQCNVREKTVHSQNQNETVWLSCCFQFFVRYGYRAIVCNKYETMKTNAFCQMFAIYQLKVNNEQNNTVGGIPGSLVLQFV